MDENTVDTVKSVFEKSLKTFEQTIEEVSLKSAVSEIVREAVQEFLEEQDNE